ncbi:MAG TPA: phosphatidylinositol kinase [Bacteroidetes bacterium]|nr:phosphatidylinositol kinase [Bacteroidota bacterium]
MPLPEIQVCPGTLTEGFATYSRICLKRMFDGKKVSHVLPYPSPASDKQADELFDANRNHISLSGVQEKFSVLLEKNRIRLVKEGERGSYILKPVPGAGKKPDQMPANEHLTMQIARQVYGIETAENALIFFNDGAPAYLTRRFDLNKDGGKLAQDDLASLAGRTPQTHGAHYKYAGNYLDMFHLLEAHLPAYKLEAPKLLKLLLFNYLFSNGDAHYKNFSLVETPLGDYRLSPAYDLLNSRIHINDTDFALEEGLLPAKLAKGKISRQFALLADHAGIQPAFFQTTLLSMVSRSDLVEKFVAASFLDQSTKRSYWQAYQSRLKQLVKEER